MSEIIAIRRLAEKQPLEEVVPELAFDDSPRIDLMQAAAKQPEPEWVSAEEIDREIEDQFPESRRRRKFRGKWRCPRLPLLTASLAVGLYISVLAASQVELVGWDLARICYDEKLAKQVGDAAFKFRDAFDPKWRYLCHISRLRDFLDPNANRAELAESLLFWQTRKKHTWDGSEEEYDRRFSKHLETFMTKTPKVINVEMFPADFARDRTLWAKAASALDKGARQPKVFNELMEGKAQKTKWAVAWNHPDSYFVAKMYSDRPSYCKVIEKRELSKVRLVVSSDLDLYLKMAYVNHVFIGPWFHDDDRSPIWMSKDQTFKMWQKLGTMSCDGKDWRMPYDQEHFDQSQSSTSISEINRKHLELIERWAHGPAKGELMKVMSLIDPAILTGVLHYYQFRDDKEAQESYYNPEMEEGESPTAYALRIEDRKRLSTSGTIPYSNGVLSGWYWTAYYDTILNAVAISMAIELCKENGLDVNLNHMYAQGDDDALSASSREELAGIYLAMKSFGFKANPMKFYISQTNDEFLRRAIMPNLVTGYPARSITSILWSNPVREPEVRGYKKGSEVFSQWKLLADRLDVPVGVLPWDVDAARATRIPKRKILEWSSQPRPLKGLGYGSERREFYEYTVYKSPLTSTNVELEKKAGVYAQAAILNVGIEPWLEYSKKTVEPYPDLKFKSSVKRCYGAECPPLVQSEKHLAQVYFGKKNKTYAAALHRPWYNRPEDVRDPWDPERPGEVHNSIFWLRANKPIENIVGPRRIKPIFPANMKQLSVVQDLGLDYVANKGFLERVQSSCTRRLEAQMLWKGVKSKPRVLDGWSVSCLSRIVSRYDAWIQNELLDRGYFGSRKSSYLDYQNCQMNVFLEPLKLPMVRVAE